MVYKTVNRRAPLWKNWHGSRLLLSWNSIYKLLNFINLQLIMNFKRTFNHIKSFGTRPKGLKSCSLNYWALANTTWIIKFLMKFQILQNMQHTAHILLLCCNINNKIFERCNNCVCTAKLVWHHKELHNNQELLSVHLH